MNEEANEAFARQVLSDDATNEVSTKHAYSIQFKLL